MATKIEVQAHYVKSIISYMGSEGDCDISLLCYFVSKKVDIDIFKVTLLKSYMDSFSS